jgi:hypothetical protein
VSKRSDPITEKYKAQRKISEKAKADIDKFSEIVHDVVKDVQEKYHISFKYGKLNKQGKSEKKT